MYEGLRKKKVLGEVGEVRGEATLLGVVFSIGRRLQDARGQKGNGRGGGFFFSEKEAKLENLWLTIPISRQKGKGGTRVSPEFRDPDQKATSKASAEKVESWR